MEDAPLKRNTTQRKAMEQVFSQHERPLNVDEVLEHGREIVKSLNQATVYRNLKMLIDDGWLKRISHPSLGVLYERTGKGHHHHFHCHSCNRVYPLPGCALRQETAVPEGFVIENHDVFLFGLCPACSG